MADQKVNRNVIRKRPTKNSPEMLSEYDTFCRNVKEGDILCGTDINKLGELLLVAAKLSVVFDNQETCSLLLLGLKKDGNRIVSNGKRIDITPQKVSFIRYLFVVGHCEYELIPAIDKYKVNQGLVVMYRNTDLKTFSLNHSRRPVLGKYGEDGKPIIKSNTNKKG